MYDSYRLGLYEKAIPNTVLLQEKFCIAKESGYDYIELSIDESEEKLRRLDWTKEEIEETLGNAQRVGIEIGSICLSAQRRYPLGEDPQQSLAVLEKALVLARGLSVPIIQLAGYDTYYHQSTKQTKQTFLETLQKAVLLAAGYGVVLGFETMETPFMDTVEKAMQYIHSVESPYLQVYPDIGNLTNAAVLYHGSVLDDLDLGKGHLVAMHIKETVPGRYREVPFGTGHVEFQSVLAKAWNLSVRRFVTEFWYTGSVDWKDGIRKTANRFRVMLDEFEQ